MTSLKAAILILSLCCGAAKCDGDAPGESEATSNEEKHPERGADSAAQNGSQGGMEAEAVGTVAWDPSGLSEADKEFYRILPLAKGKDLSGRVETFLNAGFRGPLPWEFYQSMGRPAVPLLIAVLKDKSRSSQWLNAVRALGEIGDASATEPLINFIEHTEGQQGRLESKALFAVPNSLGYLAGHGDKQALNYLIVHLPEGSWKHLKWRDESRNTDPATITDYMDQLLESRVIFGIAISGTAQGREALVAEEKRLRALNSSDIQIEARLRDIVAAIEQLDTVAATGFVELHTHKKTEPR